ncbi:cytochrome C oxidase subunit IV family protein [Paenibacillus thermoaerophilus]|jgi:cytochrome c oxidase subunit 4|uniref:Cytochrome C oxidase subunit IV family protein n=1 Tax=Paenibacillus thermoaerophilus TaxID=1215385 RepID=A0ABW2V3R8_9BACL|nr:cytochrome C oxidase subunit IV family protein [Paenibacillus thermoaerophilus]TMV18223.1 cytochrome C oxidase subunit IV [Paenibacillus thermoaerophilus]
MAANHHTHETNKPHRYEGPKNHLITFAVSILLTALAFFAVMANLGKTFTIMFIVLLAIVQAAFQLYVWMHAKDRGHTYAKIGIFMGGIIALTAVAAVVYWMWW